MTVNVADLIPQPAPAAPPPVENKDVASEQPPTTFADFVKGDKTKDIPTTPVVDQEVASTEVATVSAEETIETEGTPQQTEQEVVAPEVTTEVATEEIDEALIAQSIVVVEAKPQEVVATEIPTEIVAPVATQAVVTVDSELDDQEIAELPVLTESLLDSEVVPTLVTEEPAIEGQPVQPVNLVAPAKSSHATQVKTEAPETLGSELLDTIAEATKPVEATPWTTVENVAKPEATPTTLPQENQAVPEVAVPVASQATTQTQVAPQGQEPYVTTIEVSPQTGQTLSTNLAGQVGEVVRRVAIENGPEQKSMRVEIRPPDLGHMTIRIEQTPNRMVAEIVASEVVTTEMLLHEKDFLLEALGDLGFSDTQVDIRFGNEQEQADQQNESNNGGDSVELPLPSVDQSEPQLEVSSRGVDLIA